MILRAGLPLRLLLGAGHPSPASPRGIRFPVEGWRERAEVPHLCVATGNITPFSWEKSRLWGDSSRVNPAVASSAGRCLSPALGAGEMLGHPVLPCWRKASSRLPGEQPGTPPGSAAMLHVLGSGASSRMTALAAFLSERNKAGTESGDELEAPSVTAVPAGFMWTRLPGSGSQKRCVKPFGGCPRAFPAPLFPLSPSSA